VTSALRDEAVAAPGGGGRPVHASMRGVTRVYGDPVNGVRALAEIDLDLRRGEYY
jgi:hypothetical protein